MPRRRDDYRALVQKRFAAMPGETIAPGWRVHSFADAQTVEVPAPRNGDRWGPWVYHARTHQLIHEGRDYPINLDTCTTCAKLLDVVFHVSLKTWMTREAIGHLVQALQDLLEPMPHLCSFGQDLGPFNAKQWLQTRPKIRGGAHAAHPQGPVDDRPVRGL